MRPSALLSRLVLGALLIAGGLSCADSPTGPGPETAPTGALVLSDSLFTAGARVTASVAVPSGFSLVSGSVKWTVVAGSAAVQGIGGGQDSVTITPTDAGALQLRAEYRVRGAITAVSTTIAGPRRRVVSEVVVQGEQAVTVAAPTLAFATTPNASYVAGAPISNLRVEIRDARGRVLTGATDTVVLALDPATASGATLLGTLRAPAVAGVATFGGLSIRKAGSGYRLVASSAGAAGTPFVQTAIIAGAPSAAQSTIAVADSVRPAGTTSTVIVSLNDEYGNPVLTAGRDAFQTTATAGTVGLFTCSAGVCTAVYSVPTAVGTPSIAATIGGAALQRSPATLRVTAGRAVKFLVTGSATQVAGTSQLVTITAVDEFGNVVTDYAGDRLITFSGAQPSLTGVAPTAGSGPMQSAITLRFVNGVATASMTLYRSESPTINVTDGTIGSSGGGGLAVTVSATTPDAGQTTYTVTETTETVGGTTVVRVTVRDQYGNVVPTAKPSDFSVTPSAGSLGAFTCVSGVCEATYTAPTIPGTPTFTAKVGTTDVPAGSSPTAITVSPGAPDATRSTLVLGDSVLAQGGSTIATVTLRDVYGNLVTTAGASAFAAATTVGTLDPFTCTNAVCTSTVRATALGAGSVTATIGGTNVAGSPAQIRFTGGAAARLKITGAATQVAGASQQITITAYDAFGNVATSYTGAKSLTFSGAAVAVSGTAPTISATPFASATAVTFADGVATVPMRLYKTETPLIAAGDGTISAANADRLSVAVTAGPVDAARSSLAVSQTSVAVEQTVVVAVTLRDAWGNVVPSAGPSDFVGSISAGGGTLAQPFTCTDGVCTSTYTAPSASGSVSLTATVGGTTIQGAPTTVAITPTAASRLRITGTATQVAGATQTITITALDPQGNVVTAYAGDKTLTFSGALAALAGSVGPSVAATAFASPTTLTFTAGVATAPMVLVRADAAAQTIAASDGIVASTGADRLGVTVSAGAADASASSHAVSRDSIDVGQTLTDTVTIRDAFGNPVPNPTIPGTASVVVTTGTLGAFTCSALGVCTATYTPPTVSPAAPVFSATIGGAPVPSNRTVKVGAAPAAFFRIVGANSTQTTTQTTDQSQAITITALDTLGNVVPGFTGTQSLTFAGANLAPDNSAPGIAIGAAGPFTWTAFGAATTVTFANGVSVNANLRVTKVETAQIAATASGITTPTANRLQVTVGEGAIDASKSSLEVLDPVTLTPETTVSVNGALTVRVTLRDRFGNPVTTATPGSFVGAVAGTGILGAFNCTSGVCTATYTAPGTTGSETLTAKVGGVDIGTAPTNSPRTITVTSGVPASLVVAGNLTQVAGTTQTVTIEAHDSQGSRAQTYTGPKTITFGALNTAPDGTLPLVNASDVLTGRAITFANGLATVSVTLVKAGITEVVTASDLVGGLNTSAALSVAVTPGAADAASSPLSLSANPVTVGSSVDATVTVKDSLGNAVASVPNPNVIVFSDTAAVGAFDRVTCTGNVCTAAYTAPRAPQTVKIAATLGGTRVLNSPQSLVVNTLSASRLKVELVTPFSAPTDTAFVAGVARRIRIRALDGLDNTVTSFTGSVAVEFDQTTVGLAPDNSTYPGAPGIIPSAPKIANNLYPAGATLTFSAGVAEADLIIYKAGERAVIKAKSTARSITNFSTDASDWQVIPVVADVASPVRSTLQLVGATPVLPGEQRDLVVTLKDLYGNPIQTTAGQAPPAGANLALTLSPASPTGGTLAALSTFVCNATGVCTGTLAYTAPSTPVAPVTITGSIGGTNFTQSPVPVTLGAGPAARLKITGVSPQTAGNSQNVTVTAYDANGNVATSYTGTKSLTFGGATIAPDGTTNPTTGSAIPFGTAQNVTFTNGVSAAVSMRLVKVETATITVSDGTLQATVANTGALAVTVNAGVADAAKSTITASANPIFNDGIDPSTITLVIKDAFGNPRNETSVAMILVSGSGTPAATLTNSTTGTYAGPVTATTGTSGTFGFTFTGSAVPFKQITVNYMPANRVICRQSQVAAQSAASSVTVSLCLDANANDLEVVTLALDGSTDDVNIPVGFGNWVRVASKQQCVGTCTGGNKPMNLVVFARRKAPGDGTSVTFTAGSQHKWSVDMLAFESSTSTAIASALPGASIPHTDPSAITTDLTSNTTGTFTGGVLGTLSTGTEQNTAVYYVLANSGTGNLVTTTTPSLTALFNNNTGGTSSTSYVRLVRGTNVTVPGGDWTSSVSANTVLIQVRVRE